MDTIGKASSPSRPAAGSNAAAFRRAGAPRAHDYADIHLMEELDTDYLAPVEEAVDGVLDTRAAVYQE